MIISSPSIPKNIWFAAFIGVVILSAGLLLLHHAPIAKKDIAATGFMFDIMITFPVTYYFLVIRPLKLRKWSIVLVFTLCCVVAYFILPEHQQSYIIQLRKLTFVLELGMLIYFIIKARKIRAEYKSLQAVFPDIAYNLYKSMATMLGDGMYVKVVASELTVLRFGLLCWKKQKKLTVEAQTYTVHKESNYPVLFGVVLFACLVEMTGVHLVLLHYSKLAAIIVSILSLYGTVFILSDLSAVLKSPVLIMEDKLLLRVGLRWRALVNKNNIASIEKIKDNFWADKSHFKGGVIKTGINTLITFKHPVIIERLYRKPIETDKIIMSIDRVDDFMKEYLKPFPLERTKVRLIK